MGLSSKKTTSTQTTTPNNPSWLEPQLNTLAGRITDLSNMDPYSFVAGPNALQTQAAGSAASLAPDTASYGGAQSLYQGLMNTGASQYDPATVHPNSILPNIDAYMSPYLKDVLGSSLADYDYGAGQTRAQNKLALANDDTFGGSGGAIQTALSEDAIDRGRGTLASGLLNQGYQSAANLANLDADRRQQAQLANQAAFNQARQFNASQTEAALARQQAAAQGLVNTASSQNQTAANDINTQAAIGAVLQQLAQQQAGAPLSTLSSLVSAYGGLPLSLLHGETTNGVTKQSGSVLDALGGLAQIASSGWGSNWGSDLFKKLKL